MILNADVDFSQVIGLSFLNTGTKNKGNDCIDFGFIKEMEDEIEEFVENDIIYH
jgi:hypothetical protein